ncbi:MAG TPA: copper chaperone PCu(A)C [Allosphingosinicella sp.]|nr:copper chaperone PCu(A)C [Allosphingosinicella sp.]
MLDLAAAAVKGLGYAAALGAVGITLAQNSLAGFGGALAPGPRRLVRAAGALLAISACYSAFLYFLRLGGEADAAILGALFLSPLGAALALQLVGGLWLALAPGRPAAFVAALLILAAFGTVGHSAARGLPSSLSVVVHVCAAAWWFGGLWLLLSAARRSTPDEFVALVSRFSRQAIWVVLILLAAALLTAALILEFRFDLGLAYERGLLAKAGLTALLLLLAGVNKFVLTPRLASSDRALPWLRRAILAELGLFVGIMGATAFLTTYLSPHEDHDGVHAEAGAPQVDGPIAVYSPWAPAMPGGAGTGGGYMTLVNNQPFADRLVAARSEWAEHVTLHRSSMDGNISRMRDIESLAIPAGGRITLAPGSYHLMFTGLYAPFVEGDVVPITLVFERAGEVNVTLAVGPIGGMPDHSH